MKSGKRRIDKYSKKLDPGVIGKRYDDTKELSVALETKYFAKAEQLQVDVKALIGSMPVIFQHFYMNFAEQIEKKKTSNERMIIFETWEKRGLDECKLIEIAKKLFNFTIPSLKRYEFYITGDTDESYVYGPNWNSQTIIIGYNGDNENFNITSVKLKLYRNGSPGDLTVSIRKLDLANKPTGPDLSIGTINANDFTDVIPGLWYEIEMSPYTLEKDTKYAIVCRALTGSSGNWVRVRRDFTDPHYTGGQYASSGDSGVTWTLWEVYDIMFEVWGSCPIT